MGRENPAKEALILLRSRLCNPNFIFKHFSDSPGSNYSKLKFIISSSITEACNNSVLLLGPRGCGKTPVLELVLEDLLKEFPDMVSVIKLNGLLHSEDNCALKEIARQLCVEHQLLFSKMASFDDNSQFMVSMLRECGLAHKTVIFVLDEFDLFALGKQRLLYSLLDAMQSVTSQAVVIGLSCRLDADQLLEKRVRSRFSHRKLLFLPPSKDDLQRLLEHILLLPTDSSLPHDYVVEFNKKILLAKRTTVKVEFAHSSWRTRPTTCDSLISVLAEETPYPSNLTTEDEMLHIFITYFSSVKKLFDAYSNVLAEERFQEIISTLSNSDSTFNHLLRFLFSAVCCMDLQSGLLSLENFKAALLSIRRQPKLESLKDCSILELYILVCMKRLEVKEQDSYNFISVMKEYKSIHDAFQTSDYYAQNVCLRAFEHLLQRELVSFMDNRGHNQSIEFRPVKLLVSSHELHQGLKSHHSCPAMLQKLIEG